jgi:hypothetical protein
MELVGVEQKIMQDIWQSLDHSELEESVEKAAQELWKDHGHTSVCSMEWSISEGLISFCRKIYIPKDHDLCCHIVLQHHDSFITGHPGRWKMLELIVQNDWWPQMLQFIGLYCHTCDPCNHMKLHHCLPQGELHLMETPFERGDKVSVDFVVELPRWEGIQMCSNLDQGFFFICHIW